MGTLRDVHTTFGAFSVAGSGTRTDMLKVMIKRASGSSPRHPGRPIPFTPPAGEAIAMFVVALVLRAAYALVIHGASPQPSSDSITYDTVAWNLARAMGYQLEANGAFYPTAFVPPALPFTLSLLYRVVGHSFLAAVLLMCVIGALVPPLVRRLGNAMFGPSVGTTAGWLAVGHPLLVFFSGYVMTEPLFSVMLLTALMGSVSWLKTPRAGLALGAGFLWGLTVLTRPTALPLPLVVALWAWAPLEFMLSPRERVRQVALLFVGMVMVITPWTIRNAVALNAFVPVTTGGGRSLLDSNNALVWQDEAQRGGAIAVLTTEPWATRYKDLSEVQVDRAAGREAWAFLAAHVREWPAVAVAKVARLWRWNAFTPSTGDWFSGRAGLSALLRAVDPLFVWSCLMWPLAAFGLYRTVRGSRRLFQLLPLHVIALFTLGTTLYWGALRMRVPIEPLVILYAAVGLSHLVWRIRVKRAGLALIESLNVRG